MLMKSTPSVSYLNEIRGKNVTQTKNSNLTDVSLKYLRYLRFNKNKIEEDNEEIDDWDPDSEIINFWKLPYWK